MHLLCERLGFPSPRHLAPMLYQYELYDWQMYLSGDVDENADFDPKLLLDRYRASQVNGR